MQAEFTFPRNRFVPCVAFLRWYLIFSKRLGYREGYASGHRPGRIKPDAKKGAKLPNPLFVQMIERYFKRWYRRAVLLVNLSSGRRSQHGGPSPCFQSSGTGQDESEPEESERDSS